MAYDEAFENDSATDIDSPRSGGDDAYDSSELQQVTAPNQKLHSHNVNGCSHRVFAKANATSLDNFSQEFPYGSFTPSVKPNTIFSDKAVATTLS